MAERIYSGVLLGGPADGGQVSSASPTVQVPVFLPGGFGVATYHYSELYGIFIEEDVTDPARAVREGDYRSLRRILFDLADVRDAFVKHGLEAHVGETTAATFKRWLTELVMLRKEMPELNGRITRLEEARAAAVPITKTSDSQIIADLQREVCRLKKFEDEHQAALKEIAHHKYPFPQGEPLFVLIDRAIDTERERAHAMHMLTVARLVRIVYDRELSGDRPDELEREFASCLERVHLVIKGYAQKVADVDQAVLDMQATIKAEDSEIAEVRGVLQAHGYPSDGKPLESLIDSALAAERQRGRSDSYDAAALAQQVRAHTLTNLSGALGIPHRPMYAGEFKDHLDIVEKAILDRIGDLQRRVSVIVRDAVKAKGEECAGLRRRLAQIQETLQTQCAIIENEL